MCGTKPLPLGLELKLKFFSSSAQSEMINIYFSYLYSSLFQFWCILGKNNFQDMCSKNSRSGVGSRIQNLALMFRKRYLSKTK